MKPTLSLKLNLFVLISLFGLGTYSFTAQSYHDLVLDRCVQNGTLAITFDDGPDHHYTADLLDVLRDTNVTATFFVLGYSIVEGEALILRTVTEGHTVGSHTWNHVDLTQLTRDQIIDELSSVADLLVDILGAKPRIMRPPYGTYDRQVVEVIAGELNYTMINWSIDTNDWKDPGNTSAGLLEYIEVLNNTDPENTPGFISLHHDVQPGAAELAAAAIEYAQSLGYRFVSMETCLTGREGEDEGEGVDSFASTNTRRSGYFWNINLSIPVILAYLHFL